MGARAGQCPERGAWLRLALAPEVGPVLARRLLAAFGSPEKIFQASEKSLLAVPRMSAARAAGLRDGAAAARAKDEMEKAGAAGVQIVLFIDEQYPALLKRLENPPLVLWVRGGLAPADALSVAVVGPRKPSQYARLMARQLSSELAARGLTIISGLAMGIDGEAHQAALDAGGRTLAVLGQGLGTQVAPQSNADLARRIIEEDKGALVSIFPMETEGHPGNFPARNEIIAGLALGTLVVEAGETSGSLITARHAAEQHRPVMACPADATRIVARGSNRLIADGAALVQTSDDALAALGDDLRRVMIDLGLANPEKRDAGQVEMNFEDAAEDCGPAFALKHADLGPVASAALELVAAEPLPSDVLLERLADLGHPRAAVLDQLLELELLGFVEQLPGRVYTVKKAGGKKRGG